jgi:pilus assembly protein CpaE
LINKIGVPKRPEIPVEEFLKPFASCPNFVIPFDAILFGTAANNGQMLFEASASSSIEKTLLDVARFVAGRSQNNVTKVKKPIAELLNRFVGFRR